MIPNEKLAAGILRNDTLGSTLDRPRRLGLAAARGRRRARARRAARGDRRRCHRRRDRRRGACGSRSAATRCRRRRSAAREAELRAECLRRLRAEGLLQGGSSAARRRIRQGYTRWFALLPSALPDEPVATQQAAPPRPRSPMNKALLAMHGRAGSARASPASPRSATSSRSPPPRRRSPRSSRAIPARSSEVYAADGTRLGFIQSDELRRRVARQPRSRRCSRTPRSRSRTSASTSTRASTTRASCAPRVKNLVEPEDRAGRLDDHDAAGPQPLHRDSERTYQRKIREAKLAEELENEHNKNWILDKYLNTVPYGTVGGQTAVGVQAAARIYFNKPRRGAQAREAALLAGLPQAPSPTPRSARPSGDQGAAQRGAAQDGRARR